MSRDRTAIRVAESRLCAPSDERRGNLLIACSSFVKNAVAERPPWERGAPAPPSMYATPKKTFCRRCQSSSHHRLLGFDHLCFLVALVVVGSFRDLLKIITAFTIAHSVTLCLAALHVVSLPTRLVETAIAATIIYVAVENILCRPSGWRWALAGVFGLVHGFGYAAALETLGMPAEGLMRCLLAFNIGVEAGQLFVILCLLPIIAAMQRSVHREWVMKGFSTALAMVGCAWFVDRLFDKGWIQF